MSTLLEIKKIKILDHISSEIKLSKKGRYYQGICPFHDDTKPSLFVNEKKNCFNCFACGARGDIIEFEKKIKNIEFKKAVENIATQYGISLDYSFSQKEDINPWKKDLLDYIDRTKKLFEYRKIILTTRNLGEKEMEKYGVISVKWDDSHFQNLFNAYLKDTDDLKKEIFNPSSMKNRLVIVIKDEKGRPVGFSGRSLDGIDPKYLNSPESEIFQKHKLLFNLNNCERNDKPLFLTEGYFDAIALSKLGNNAVAVMGSSLSDEQILLMGRYNSIVLCFDNDAAGIKATVEASKNLIGRGFSVYATSFDKKFKDIDETINAGASYKVVSILDYLKDSLDLAESRALSNELVKLALNPDFASELIGDYSKIIGIDIELFKNLNEKIKILEAEKAEMVRKISHFRDNRDFWKRKSLELGYKVPRQDKKIIKVVS